MYRKQEAGQRAFHARFARARRRITCMRECLETSLREEWKAFAIRTRMTRVSWEWTARARGMGSERDVHRGARRETYRDVEKRDIPRNATVVME
jgi:hypothetical protein